MDKLFQRLCWALIILSTAIAGIVLVNRHRVENSNRSVELTLDYAELKQISVATGTSMATLLTRLKQCGISSVSLPEQTLNSLQGEGGILVFPNERIKELTFLNLLPQWMRLANNYRQRIVGVVKAERKFDQAGKYLRSKVRGVRYFKIKSCCFFTIPDSPEILDKIGLGFSSELVSRISRTGLGIILRPGNYRATPESINQLFKEARNIRNLSGMIFSGDEVLGYPGSLEITRKQLQSQKIKLGCIEFVQQRGIRELTRDLPGTRTVQGLSLVRVHSIKSQEMAQKAVAGLIDRFLRAVKERNVRLLYIHLFPEDLEKNLNYIAGIKQRLEGRGYEVGGSSSFKNYTPGFISLFLMSLGIAGGIGLLLRKGLGMNWWAGIVLIVLLGVFFCLLAGENLTLARQSFAFFAAITFPVVTLSFFATGAQRSLPPFISSVFPWVSASPWLRTLGVFLSVSGTTLIGGLLIAGLLSQTSFMLGIEQFRGIKLAYILPLIIFLCILAKQERNFFREPILLGDAILLGILGAGIILGLLRSGNFGFPVSGVELKFRAALGEILFVRPRFKEFLFGHPALILGLWFWLKDGRVIPARLLCFFGVIGQVSLINTFCHLHTPIAVCLLRSFHGLWLGILFGMILIALLNKFKYQKSNIKMAKDY